MPPWPTRWPGRRRHEAPVAAAAFAAGRGCVKIGPPAARGAVPGPWVVRSAVTESWPLAHRHPRLYAVLWRRPSLPPPAHKGLDPLPQAQGDKHDQIPLIKRVQVPRRIIGAAHHAKHRHRIHQQKGILLPPHSVLLLVPDHIVRSIYLSRQKSLHTKSNTFYLLHALAVYCMNAYILCK